MTNIDSEIILSAHDLAIGYSKSRRKGGMALYSNLSFNLYRGELTCLLGANGAGKSTLLRTISALQVPLGGRVDLIGKPLNKYSEQELSYLLGLVLTDKTSVGALTVYELVALGRYPHTGFFGKLSTEDHCIIKKAIADTGITQKATTYIAELSDGERQKAMIAKVLAQQCDVIILDEPTAFLDVTSRIDVINLLRNLAMSQNKAILMSTHDIELALMLADRLWLLSQANGLQCGVTEDILFSGTIARFLDRKDITFDIRIGGFNLNIPRDKTAYINVPDEYYRWTRNFLQRNGYKLIDDKNQTPLQIIIDQWPIIQLYFNGTEMQFNSFAQLGFYLRNLSE